MRAREREIFASFEINFVMAFLFRAIMESTYVHRNIIIAIIHQRITLYATRQRSRFKCYVRKAVFLRVKLILGSPEKKREYIRCPNEAKRRTMTIEKDGHNGSNSNTKIYTHNAGYSRDFDNAHRKKRNELTISTIALDFIR